MAEMYRAPSVSPYPIALFGLGILATIVDDELFDAGISATLSGTLAAPALAASATLALQAVLGGTLAAPSLSATSILSATNTGAPMIPSRRGGRRGGRRD